MRFEPSPGNGSTRPAFRRALLTTLSVEPSRASDERSEERVEGYMWYVYMLKCQDGAIYTGITDNIARRFIGVLHNDLDQRFFAIGLLKREDTSAMYEEFPQGMR